MALPRRQGLRDMSTPACRQALGPLERKWAAPEGAWQWPFGRLRGDVYIQRLALFRNVVQIPDASAVGAEKNVSTNMSHTFAVSAASGGRIIPENT